MIAKVKSFCTLGIECQEIRVEADVSNGLPNFLIVGLGDTAVQEAKERVRTSIKNLGVYFPSSRITVNLAPADVKKVGAFYDLPIAISLMLAKGYLESNINLEKTAFIGELSLDGKLRRVSGVLAICLHAVKRGIEKIILPKENAREASLVKGLEIIAEEDLAGVVNYLSGKKEKELISFPEIKNKEEETEYDFAYVYGQLRSKRALEIAAAGGHNVIMSGSPGSGKTMMAKCFQGILPDLSYEESLELTRIYSVASKLNHEEPLIQKRPFRIIHHTASSVSLVGGGRIPLPGEISLADKGVLLLDEMPEFPRAILEVLRQPLEDKKITVTRVNGQSTFPADFILLATKNPCPCGYFEVKNSIKSCVCTASQIANYQKKISGPLLDRIDLYLEISPIKVEDLGEKKQLAESSAEIKKRVIKAREIQKNRFRKIKITTNSQMTNKQILKYCQLDASSESLIKMAMKKLGLSARAYHRTLKVSRTIADIDQSEQITAEHIKEAIMYRKLDEKSY